MVIALRARRAPAPLVGVRPVVPAPRPESVWPVGVLPALAPLSLLVMALVVFVIFSPSTTGPFG